MHRAVYMKGVFGLGLHQSVLNHILQESTMPIFRSGDRVGHDPPKTQFEVLPKSDHCAPSDQGYEWVLNCDFLSMSPAVGQTITVLF